MLVLLAVVSSTGCVRRRLTVRTNPPGAMIYVDGRLIGPSPASTQFTYWATREIVAVGDGYRTEKVLRTFRPPWYQIPPLDFVSEVLWPYEIRSEHVVDLTMVPQPTVASEDLLARANQLRGQAAVGIATPIGRGNVGTVPGGQVMPPAGTVPVVPVMPPDGAVLPPNQPAASGWRPGQWLQGFFQPNGGPVESIPEVQGLQRGGYRPEINP